LVLWKRKLILEIIKGKTKMTEEVPNTPIDLNALRDKVLAGEETGHSGPDFSGKTREEVHAETHFVNPELHPDMDPGPSVEALRQAIKEEKASRAEEGSSGH
jgi:hypothetical protein